MEGRKLRYGAFHYHPPPFAMTRLPLFGLALLLPFAACTSEPDTVTTDETVIETTDPVVTPDPMMDDPSMNDGTMSDVTAQGTVDAVTNAGGLTSLSVPAATQNIDGWIAQLEGNPDFAPLVEDLRTLKTQLMASPIDGSSVGGTLQRLGSATTGAAGGDSALEALGSTLTSAGDQLAGGAM